MKYPPEILPGPLSYLALGQGHLEGMVKFSHLQRQVQGLDQSRH